MKKPLSYQQVKGIFQSEDEEMLSILLLLYQGREKGRHIGRKEISQQLPAYGVRLSEGEVRSRLQKLAAAGLACTPLASGLWQRWKATERPLLRGAAAVWEVIHPVVLLLLSAMALAGDSYNPLLYFQF